MAFGFPAYHEERVLFPDVSDGELMDALDEAIRRLGWSAYESGRWELRGNTGISFWSWGEAITAAVEGDGALFVRSQCSFPTQCIDWGANSGNVNKLVRELEDLLEVRARSRRDAD